MGAECFSLGMLQQSFFVFVFVFVCENPKLLPGPPFWVFSPPGMYSFFVPLIFVWIALSGFQSTGTLSIA